MARKLREVDSKQVQAVVMAVSHLKRARVLLKSAGCDETVKRVRFTLKSADGALRHVNRAFNDAARNKRLAKIAEVHAALNEYDRQVSALPPLQAFTTPAPAAPAAAAEVQ